MKNHLNDEAMQLIANMLKTFMPDNWGFTLLTFETNNDAAKILYISSAERESMKETMRSMIDKWDGLEEIKNINPN